MVEILYKRNSHSLRLRGHAGAGEPGKDPVCAGVSALTLTLADNVAQLVTQGSADRPLLRLESGDSWIRCRSTGRMKPVVTLIFDSICSGFQLLHTLYPDYIDYRVQE